jgi:hypothetical protein
VSVDREAKAIVGQKYNVDLDMELAAKKLLGT